MQIGEMPAQPALTADMQADVYVVGAGIAGMTTAYLLARQGQSVIVLDDGPMNDLVAIHTQQAPYRTYVIGARAPRGSVVKGLYWDTLDPYHYVRLQNESAGKGNSSG